MLESYLVFAAYFWNLVAYKIADLVCLRLYSDVSAVLILLIFLNTFLILHLNLLKLSNMF